MSAAKTGKDRAAPVITAPSSGSLAFAGSCPAWASARGTMDAGPQMMAYQIDSNAPVTFSSYAGTNWQITLTDEDCPVVNESYLLTIYAYYGSSGGAYASCTFTRTS